MLTPSHQATPPSVQETFDLQFNQSDCRGSCVFFGTATAHEGKVTLNGVFAYAYAQWELIPILGTGFDLQDVSQDGRRLLVNTEDHLYEINLKKTLGV